MGATSVSSTCLGLARLTDTSPELSSDATPVTYVMGRGNLADSTFIVFDVYTVNGTGVVNNGTIQLDGLVIGACAPPSPLSRTPPARPAASPPRVD